VNVRELLAATVADVIAASPVAATVLTARGMACVGCAFAPFETLDEVARTYAVDPIALATAIHDSRITTRESRFTIDEDRVP
jgi:hybrid cluster-associated redox disulfide protein